MRQTTKYKALNFERFRSSRFWNRLDSHAQRSVTIASTVLPFRTNEYVLEELIDWDNIPADPIYQLTIPQRKMLRPEDFERMSGLLELNPPKERIITAANDIRRRLNPNQAGQFDHNTPELDGRPIHGLQHKYAETVLFFPGAARTCHAYCTFCFRWPLVTDHSDFKVARPQIEDFAEYLRRHREVTDVLFTGGDPMVMSAKLLAKHIDPLLEPGMEHVRNIRIGTKSVAYWPQRFVSDADADDIIRLFERVIAAGKHLAIMGHYSHPRELSTDIAVQAARRIRSTGANIRMQSPVVRRVNDHPRIWVDLWKKGVSVGAVPYYMFVERDTGPKEYFEIPLVRVLEIYQEAFRRVSGLVKTCRGPSMSAFFGKIRIVDVLEVARKKVFALEYLQARDPEFLGNLFFADFDPEATWFDDLEPAFAGDDDYIVKGPDDMESVQKTA